jgi:hypothetical protein
MDWTKKMIGLKNVVLKKGLGSRRDLGLESVRLGLLSGRNPSPMSISRNGTSTFEK